MTGWGQCCTMCTLPNCLARPLCPVRPCRRCWHVHTTSYITLLLRLLLLGEVGECGGSSGIDWLVHICVCVWDSSCLFIWLLLRWSLLRLSIFNGPSLLSNGLFIFQMRGALCTSKPLFLYVFIYLFSVLPIDTKPILFPISIKKHDRLWYFKLEQAGLHTNFLQETSAGCVFSSISSSVCVCICFSSFLITVFLIFPLSSFASLSHCGHWMQPNTTRPLSPCWLSFIIWPHRSINLYLFADLSLSQFIPFSLPPPGPPFPLWGLLFRLFH